MKKNSNVFENYLFDLGMILKEMALDAKKTKNEAVATDNHDYELGYLMAFHEIISLMLDQANLFEISPEQIGLSDIDPDGDLL